MTKNTERRTFQNSFKKQVIDHVLANKISKREAARKFGIDPATVRDWLNRKEAIVEAPSKTSIHRGPTTALMNQLDSTLSQWIDEMKQTQCVQAVTAKMIMEQASKLSPEFRFKPDSAQRSWTERFIKRQKLKSQTAAHREQRTPEETLTVVE